MMEEEKIKEYIDGAEKELREKFEELKAEGVIADGMLPKIENAFKALDEGSCEVVIKNSDALLEDSGTRICK